GEASDFVIYEHEFVGESYQLTPAGQDHVKQIAARVGNTTFPVIVEQSESSVRPDSEYGYPVSRNPQLDATRREVIVHALSAMGVADADQRVLVSPALAEGFEDGEAEHAYFRGISGNGFHGNGFFGFGGFGGFSSFGF
ncbi:MAG: hypothetical protein ACOC46_03020, partial [Pirellulales bacterium]